MGGWMAVIECAGVSRLEFKWTFHHTGTYTSGTRRLDHQCCIAGARLHCWRQLIYRYQISYRLPCTCKTVTLVYSCGSMKALTAVFVDVQQTLHVRQLLLK